MSIHNSAGIRSTHPAGQHPVSADQSSANSTSQGLVSGFEVAACNGADMWISGPPSRTFGAEVPEAGIIAPLSYSGATPISVKDVNGVTGGITPSVIPSIPPNGVIQLQAPRVPPAEHQTAPPSTVPGDSLPPVSVPPVGLPPPTAAPPVGLPPGAAIPPSAPPVVPGRAPGTIGVTSVHQSPPGITFAPGTMPPPSLPPMAQLPPRLAPSGSGYPGGWGSYPPPVNATGLDTDHQYPPPPMSGQAPQMLNGGMPGVPPGTGPPSSNAMTGGPSSIYERKIFVGGLNYDTTDESLAKCFQTKYGEVEQARVMVNKSSNVSRGFGFLIFKEAHSVEAAIADSPVPCDGCSVEIRKAQPKRLMQQDESVRHVQPPNISKVFVGGLDQSVSPEGLENFFAQYGQIQSAELICDRVTTKSRGFGFVIFQRAEDAASVVGRHPTLSRSCEVKLAFPKTDGPKTVPGAPTMGVPGPGAGPLRGPPMPPGMAPMGGPARHEAPQGMAYGHVQSPYGMPPPMGYEQYGGPPQQQYGAPPPQQYGAPQHSPPHGGNHGGNQHEPHHGGQHHGTQHGVPTHGGTQQGMGHWSPY